MVLAMHLIAIEIHAAVDIHSFAMAHQIPANTRKCC
jgi:hypothetical protein